MTPVTIAQAAGKLLLLQVHHAQDVGNGDILIAGFRFRKAVNDADFRKRNICQRIRSIWAGCQGLSKVIGGQVPQSLLEVHWIKRWAPSHPGR